MYYSSISLLGYKTLTGSSECLVPYLNATSKACIPVMPQHAQLHKRI